MVQCAKCGMQNADGSKYCRFCGGALMQDSGASARKPYSWQSEEFQVNDRTQNYQAQKTQAISPPPPPPANYQQNRPQMVQPLQQQQHHHQPAPLYQQQQHPHPQYYAYGHLYCPNCRTQVIPQMARKIAPAGWVVFAVLLITPLILFCWLGLFIKEDRKLCPICGTRLG